jgi:hypothetical protein
LSLRLAITLAAPLLLSAPACSGPPGPEPFEPWVLEDLPASRGFSLRVPAFEVPPGRESQNCYFVRVPDLDDGADVLIDQVRTAINPGSHHMNVFRVKTIVNLRPEDGRPVRLGDHDATLIEGSDDYATNPCWASSNWADWPLVANSQHANPDDPYTDWKLPTDVVIRFQPGELLMVQTHYVNTTDQPTLYGANVGINFYKHAGTGPTMDMGTLFATQQSIRICRSNPSVTYSGTCRFPNPVTIIAANGHFHKRGRELDIFAWDGQTETTPPVTDRFYRSETWDDPPMALDLAVTPAANGGIWWSCGYQWTPPSVVTCDEVNAKDPDQAGDCCYTFGGNTDVGEHCNVFLYYYPRLDTDVFCI